MSKLTKIENEFIELKRYVKDLERRMFLGGKMDRLAQEQRRGFCKKCKDDESITVCDHCFVCGRNKHWKNGCPKNVQKKNE